MTKLSKRVEKAKQLRITQTNGHFNTWGSCEDTYKIKLSSDEKEIETPDGFLTIKVFKSVCEKQILTYMDCNWQHCQGNSNHTVCYHSLGAIYKSFKDVSKQVSFYNTFRDADTGLRFGGFLAKIVNNNGKGLVWCVVRNEAGASEIREISLLPRERNIDLMRGSNDDGGID